MRRNRKRYEKDKLEKRRLGDQVKDLQSKLNEFIGKSETESRKHVLDNLNSVSDREVHPVDLEREFDKLDRVPANGGSRTVGLTKIKDDEDIEDLPDAELDDLGVVDLSDDDY